MIAIYILKKTVDWINLPGCAGIVNRRPKPSSRWLVIAGSALPWWVTTCSPAWRNKLPVKYASSLSAMQRIVVAVLSLKRDNYIPYEQNTLISTLTVRAEVNTTLYYANPSAPGTIICTIDSHPTNRLQGCANQPLPRANLDTFTTHDPGINSGSPWTYPFPVIRICPKKRRLSDPYPLAVRTWRHARFENEDLQYL